MSAAVGVFSRSSQMSDKRTQIDERTIFRHVCKRMDYQQVGAEVTVARFGL